MQYITQCSYKLHKSNYLLSRLLKNSRSHSGRPKRITTNLVCTHPAQTAVGQGPGGANRDRTDDLLLAKQALSQLSYGPADLLFSIGGSGWIRTIDPRLIKTVL